MCVNGFRMWVGVCEMCGFGWVWICGWVEGLMGDMWVCVWVDDGWMTRVCVGVCVMCGC